MRYFLEAIIDFVQRAQSTDGYVGTTPPPATPTTLAQPPQQPPQPAASTQQQASPIESNTPQQNANSQQQDEPFGYHVVPQQPIAGGPPLQQDIQAAYKQSQALLSGRTAGGTKIGPSLMSQYESVSKGKTMMTPKFTSQTEERVNNLENNARYNTQGQLKYTPPGEQKHANKAPKQQKLLSSAEVDEIKKYYEWKYTTGH